MRARTANCFWKASTQRFFSLRSCTGMRARALGAVHALARARGCPQRRLLLSRPLGGSAAKWTNVVWPIKSRQTNKPTNQQTNTHYSFIGIDTYIHIYIYIYIYIYILPVSEIGRYLFWLFSFTACVLCNTPRLFVSRGLLQGFGELLSCKKDCHCRFVVMCVHFTANCQKWSRSKSLPPRFFACCCFTWHGRHRRTSRVWLPSSSDRFVVSERQSNILLMKLIVSPYGKKEAKQFRQHDKNAAC